MLTVKTVLCDWSQEVIPEPELAAGNCDAAPEPEVVAEPPKDEPIETEEHPDEADHVQEPPEIRVDTSDIAPETAQPEIVEEEVPQVEAALEEVDEQIIEGVQDEAVFDEQVTLVSQFTQGAL